MQLWMSDNDSCTFFSPHNSPEPDLSRLRRYQSQQQQLGTGLSSINVCLVIKGFELIQF